MKIGFDTWIFRANQSGSAAHARGLLKALATIESPIQPLSPPLRFPRLNKLTTLLNLIADLFYLHVWLPIRANGCDVVHFPANFASFWSGFRRVVTINDVSFLFYPEAYDRLWLAYARFFIRWSARRAHHIITISEQSKADIMHYYAIAADKISVIYPGIDDRFQPVDAAPALEHYELDQYVLFVGDMMPRKNLLKLVEAMTLVQQQHPACELVIAGNARGTYAQDVQATIKQVDVRARLLGYVDNDLLVPLINGAAVFAFVSIYEGFGFPPLEAMACGTPVVAANTSCLPEVLGDAAEFVDPLEAFAIAKGILRVLNDQERRAELIEAGFERVSHYDWVKTARQVTAIYDAITAS